VSVYGEIPLAVDSLSGNMQEMATRYESRLLGQASTVTYRLGCLAATCLAIDRILGTSVASISSITAARDQA